MTATDVLVVIGIAFIAEVILLSIKRRTVRSRCNCQFIHCRTCRR